MIVLYEPRGTYFYVGKKARVPAIRFIEAVGRRIDIIYNAIQTAAYTKTLNAALLCKLYNELNLRAILPCIGYAADHIYALRKGR